MKRLALLSLMVLPIICNADVFGTNEYTGEDVQIFDVDSTYQMNQGDYLDIEDQGDFENRIVVVSDIDHEDGVITTFDENTGEEYVIRVDE